MLNVCYYLSSMKKRAVHEDTEGSIIYKGLFPAAELSMTYTAEHRPLLAACCKRLSGSHEQWIQTAAERLDGFDPVSSIKKKKKIAPFSLFVLIL